MRILLFGGTGLLGWELRRTLAPLGEIVAPSRAEVDLQDFDSLRYVTRGVQPDLVVNAAAYTDVDGAESEESLAHAVNADAPGVLAEVVQDLGGFLIHYSTDYVFNGEKGGAYDEDDEAKPINVYGRTKLLGEQNINNSGVSGLIFRLSWLYGARRENFLNKMLKLLRTQAEVEVVNDQIGSPTWSRTAAEATAQIVAILNTVTGEETKIPTDSLTTFHLAASGAVSRYEQAVAIQNCGKTIFPEAGLDDCQVKAVSSEEYSQTATRPRVTPLNTNRLQRKFDLLLPSWEDEISRCLEEKAPSSE